MILCNNVSETEGPSFDVIHLSTHLESPEGIEYSEDMIKNKLNQNIFEKFPNIVLGHNFSILENLFE